MAPNLKVNNYVEGHNPQKAHLHPLRDVCVQYENNEAKRFVRYRPETELIIRNQLKSNHLKIKGKKLGQRS